VHNTSTRPSSALVTHQGMSVEVRRRGPYNCLQFLRAVSHSAGVDTAASQSATDSNDDDDEQSAASTATTSTAPCPAAAAADELAECCEVCLVAPREGSAL